MSSNTENSENSEIEDYKYQEENSNNQTNNYDANSNDLIPQIIMAEDQMEKYKKKSKALNYKLKYLKAKKEYYYK